MHIRLILLVFLLTLLVPGRVWAGTIVGHVRAQGKAEAEEAASAGKYDSRKFKFVERVNYAEMRDFVVYLEGVPPSVQSAPNQPLRVTTAKNVSQKGAAFSPHVLPVMIGTTVEWPNQDEIFHNVFSMSEAKPFDLDLYKGNPPDKRVTFGQPGKVDVFCSIHANMHCIVLVMPNPYFAATDADGHYRITG